MKNKTVQILIFLTGLTAAARALAQTPTFTPTLTPTPACGAGQGVFQFLDNYPSSASLSNYTFFPGGSATPATPSSLLVAVNSGELQVGATTSPGNMVYGMVNNAQFPYSYSDYTVEADFNIEARTNNYGIFGLEFLEQSNATGYLLEWNGNIENSPPHWQVEKDTGPGGSTYTYLGGYGFGQGLSAPVYTPGNWVHLKVVVSGGGVTFNCYANLYDGNGDQLLFSNLTDTTGAPVYTSGGVGFRGGYLQTPNLLQIQNFYAYTCVSPTSTPSYQGSDPPGPGSFFIYPSPARGSQATVSYNMPQSGQVDLKVWNEKAELVTEVTDSKTSGVQVTPFSITDFATGVYFYSLTLTYGTGQVEKLGPQKFAIIH